MKLQDVHVGQLVRVVDTVPVGFNWDTFSVGSERVGTVLRIDPHDGQYLAIYIKLRDGSETWGKVADIEPVSEVIKVDCHKPNVLKRICNYLRGIK